MAETAGSSPARRIVRLSVYEFEDFNVGDLLVPTERTKRLEESICDCGIILKIDKEKETYNIKWFFGKSGGNYAETYEAYRVIRGQRQSSI